MPPPAGDSITFERRSADRSRLWFTIERAAGAGDSGAPAAAAGSKRSWDDAHSGPWRSSSSD
jgi:hypothetical protein